MSGVIYLPAFDCDWVLSRWTGRPQGLTIDPIGVEAFVAAPTAKPSGLLGRLRKAEPTGPDAYLHVLVHDELPSDRIRSWAVNQVAKLRVLGERPDAAGDSLNRLTAQEVERLTDRDWTAAQVVIDGTAHPASVFEAEEGRWAAYADLGADRLVLVGQGLTLADATLRTASTEEARQLRTDALRV